MNHPRRITRLLSLCVIALVGCAGRGPRSQGPSSGLGGGFSVRGFLYAGEYPPRGMGAYGYLVFPTRPTAENSSRHARVCTEYLSIFEPSNESSGVEQNTLMITFWPLATTPIPAKDNPNCENLVAKYNYALGSMIASSVEKSDSNGPLLVAWDTPYRGPIQTGNALVLDMSDFNDEDIGRAFRIWKNQISKGPGRWDQGLMYTKMREAIRNILQDNSQAIDKVLTSIYQ